MLSQFQSLAVQYAPYLALVVAYYVVTGLLHALAHWIAGPAFPLAFPRLSKWMAATGLNFVGALDAVASEVPKPPAPPGGKIPPIVVSMLSALLFCLVAGGIVVLVVGCSGCGAPLTGTQVAPAVDAGCVMIGVVVKDQLVGNACEDAAPLIGTLIADAVNALPAKPGDELPTHLLPVTKGGKTIGYVRSDLAPAVQAKLDGGAS